MSKHPVEHVDETAIALDASTARALTDRIKVGVEAVWELITQAYVQRAWDALGYSSWDDYCTREFGTSRLRLPREERAEVVASLRESGLSIRAISAATGLRRGTVERDIAAPVPNGTREPGLRNTITYELGCEFVEPGQEVPITRTTINADTGEVLDEQPIPNRTLGQDGKSYPPSAKLRERREWAKAGCPGLNASQPRRKPIAEAFNEAAAELTRQRSGSNHYPVMTDSRRTRTRSYFDSATCSGPATPLTASSRKSRRRSRESRRRRT